MNRLHRNDDPSDMAFEILSKVASYQASLYGQPGETLLRATRDDASKAGVAAATSMVQICFEELDGSILDREVARTFARRIVRAYQDQVERLERRTK